MCMCCLHVSTVLISQLPVAAKSPLGKFPSDDGSMESRSVRTLAVLVVPVSANKPFLLREPSPCDPEVETAAQPPALVQRKLVTTSSCPEDLFSADCLTGAHMQDRFCLTTFLIYHPTNESNPNMFFRGCSTDRGRPHPRRRPD